MRRGRIALLAGAALAIAAPAAQADPAGKTTLQETIDIVSEGPFHQLRVDPGEPFKVRAWPGRKVDSKRASRRSSLAFFGHMTDAQIADESSPVRTDWTDAAAGSLRSSHRPQEAFGLHIIDSLARNVNANSTSQVAQRKGKKAKLGFVLETGDFSDSQQLNELRSATAAMDGGAVDPYSGKPADACPGMNDETKARLNADVAARRYNGVQDYADYGDAPDARKNDYWDPDVPPPGASPYSGWPQWPGLMDRAQQPFVAEGLKAPWYAVRGNHDALVQGNLLANFPIAVGLIGGCGKILPSSSFDPAEVKGLSEAELIQKLTDPEFQQKILAGIRPAPPDPDRRFVSRIESKQLLKGADNDHGFGFVDSKEDKRAGGAATYYAFTRGGVRFIGIDTNSEGGGNDGNLDHPQYEWLAKELAKARKTPTLVFAHHGLLDLNNATVDEKAGKCETATDAGCDRDPRKSTPIHRGTKGKDTIKALLLRHRNVVGFVVGHSHQNEIFQYKAKGSRSGFWEVGTAAHVDFPQQARLFDVMDNRDGTLSLFGYMIDSAAPVASPAPGTNAAAFTDENLASIARIVSANDPNGTGAGDDDPGLGGPNDRNVELLVPDPRP
jgi:metallophosphoesterase (TIGR03767 family)